MIAAERHKKIIQLLNASGVVAVKKLCKELNVSDMTIRRDLLCLEQQGLLIRVHGGAQLLHHATVVPGTEKDFLARLGEYAKEKNEIGRTASRLVRNGQSIFLDGSSTSLHLAVHLREFERLTVLTDSLAVTNVLSGCKGIELIILGGSLQADGNTIDGPIALENIEKLTVESVFFSCSGFDTEKIYNPGMIGTSIKRVLIKKARNRTLLATSNKFGIRDFFSICFLHEVDTLVTDSHMSDENVQRLKSCGIDIILAEKLPESHHTILQTTLLQRTNIE